VVCVHGLTGSGRDFDELALALVAAGYRVVCPDLAGRGRSDRLLDAEGYALGQYVADVDHVLGSLALGDVVWIGTSLGGLIGMAMAGRPATRIQRLVLNDVGAFVAAEALGRIGQHLGNDPWFADLRAAEAHVRTTRPGAGDLTDAQWRSLSARSVRAAEDGGYRLLYDPRIAIRYRRSATRDVDFWDTWDRITCPVLVLRGVDSDFLDPEVARAMTRRGPRAALVELPGRGHPPPLLDPSDHAPILDWLGPAGRARR
jgi:pimeloyl-ACP methyl ester carboxylesterase